MKSKFDKNNSKEDVLSNINQKIIEALKDIKYGSVTLVIQDGHIIQIDKSQKIRLV